MRPNAIEDTDQGHHRRTASLAGLAGALLMVVIGLYLVHVLGACARVETCLMAGRHDCDRLVAAATR